MTKEEKGLRQSEEAGWPPDTKALFDLLGLWPRGKNFSSDLSPLDSERLRASVGRQRKSRIRRRPGSRVDDFGDHLD